jgi:hypothetical protein
MFFVKDDIFMIQQTKCQQNPLPIPKRIQL